MSDKETYARLAARIRAHAVRMTHRASSAHVGTSLSMADMLAVLYEKVLRVDPKNPKKPDRDRFILSKGHGAAGCYAALAEKGFFPKEWLDTFYMDGGKLCGHMSHSVPGVEVSTGSLGHGLSIATGMALHGKRSGSGHRVWCLMSDGDMNAGSTWEAIMFAPQHKLDNLIGIADNNQLQALGRVENVIDMEPYVDKLKAFRWAVREIDGHNFDEIEDAFMSVPFESGKPSFVIARTIKGKGVSFMENDVAWHYKCADEEQLKQAYKELGVTL